MWKTSKEVNTDARLCKVQWIPTTWSEGKRIPQGNGQHSTCTPGYFSHMTHPGLSGPGLYLWKTQKQKWWDLEQIFDLWASKWSANVPWLMHTVTPGKLSSDWNALLSRYGDRKLIEPKWRTCLGVQSRGQLHPGKCLLPSFCAKPWGFLHIRMYSYIPLWPFMGKPRVRFHMQAALQPLLGDWRKCWCKLKAMRSGSGTSTRCGTGLSARLHGLPLCASSSWNLNVQKSNFFVLYDVIEDWPIN